MLRNFSANASDWSHTIGCQIRKPNLTVLGRITDVVSEIPHGTQEQCYYIVSNGERINVNKTLSTKGGDVKLKVY